MEGRGQSVSQVLSVHRVCLVSKEHQVRKEPPVCQAQVERKEKRAHVDLLETRARTVSKEIQVRKERKVF